MRLLSAIALVLLPGVAQADAHGETVRCRAPGLPSFDLTRAPDLCEIDGRAVQLMADGPTTICHISSPQLRILTVEEDLGFTWEDTDSDRIFRGTCS